MGRGGAGLDGLRVFAVEDRAVQVAWGRLDGGTTHVRLGDDERDVRDRASGGATTFEGLAPDQEHAVIVSGPEGERRLPVRTLPSPPGPERYRFGTVSDIHIGIDHFDLFHRMREEPADDESPHPVRCTRAALREMGVWGAQRAIVKGDITEASLAEEWSTAGSVLREQPLPVDVMAGNHDYGTEEGRVGIERGGELAGLDIHRGVQHLDVPGLRLVFVETSVPGRHLGTITSDTCDLIVEAVRAAPAAVVLLHHQLQPALLPLYWPPGIPHRQTRRFLDALAAANRRVVVTSGHTHRHRRRDAGPVVTTEVGSPKDYPGTWGGYVVHEGGIRQVARRVEAPECAAWLERTRHAAFGLWGRWSPGQLDDRCFTHVWPD